MHLLLFLALLAPPSQPPQVQVDPNYNCMMRGTCIATGQPTQIVITVHHTPTTIPLAQQTYLQLQAEYNADIQQYWSSDHSKDETALMDEIHALNVELDKRDQASIQTTTDAILVGFAQVAAKARVHAWRMDECQHRRLRNLYRKPSYCKVVK